ncbi:MAG: 6-carboxytetrahydropterin synthase QueD [Chloroflexi bacterium RBG_16_57_8]|nr:MAG: 6-carboxytetrahydropterin synthase QueD [Chloroflexi bacterium RBG_16_57_8]
MYEISVEQEFDAAHALRGYEGKCEKLHGHRYRVAVTIRASQLNEIGLAYDFTLLKKQAAEVLDRFDHTYLNDTPPFDKINPSAENIATTVYHEMKTRLVGAPVSILRVEVWESPTSRAEYRPDE